MADPAPRGLDAAAGRGEEHPGLAARASRGCTAATVAGWVLEVRLEGEPQDDLFLIEVATYPERRVGQQMTDDLLLVYPCRLQWHVVELWTIPAAELLQAGDVGLIPWVPLTDFAEPPEAMLQRCRESIEQHVPRDLSEEIESVDDAKQLRGLVRLAASCPDLDAFRRAVARS